MATATPEASHDVVREARELFNNAVLCDRENRDAAREDLDFLNGNQWHTQDLQDRKKARRPTLTIPRLKQALKQVTNEVRKNRPAISCTAADGAANPHTAEVFEGLIRAIERVSGAGRVYSRAIEQSAGCGMGHFRLNLEYENDETFDLGLRIRTIRNPFSVVWDPTSAMDDRSDAKYCFVYEELSKDQFKQRYPGVSDAAWSVSAPTAVTSTSWRHDAKTTTVCEYWYVTEEPITLTRVAHNRASYDPELGHQPPTNKEATLESADPQLLQEIHGQGFDVIGQRTAMRKKVCMYLLGANTVLEGPIEWPGQRIPIFTVVGDEVDDGVTVTRSSMIRDGKDSQRLLNYYVSANAEMHALAPKVPFVGTLRQFAGLENIWGSANQGARSYLAYNDVDESGPINAPPPQRSPGINANPGLIAGEQAASEYIKATTGVYDSSLGNQSRETSGVAINARDAQADTGTFNFIDNLALTVESMAREMVNVIPLIYPPERQIRILGPDDEQAIIDLAQSGHDLRVGKYDVSVKLGPAFATQRDEVLEGLIEMAKGAVAPPLQTLLYIKALRLQDFHGADELADEVQQVATQIGLLPPPMPPQAPPGAPPAMAGPPGMPPPAGAPQGPPQGMPPGMPMPQGAPMNGPPIGPPGAPMPGMGPGGPPPNRPPTISINYKDAPPDVRREMEAAAGLRPSSIGDAPINPLSDFPPAGPPASSARVAPRFMPQGARG